MASFFPRHNRDSRDSNCTRYTFIFLLLFFPHLRTFKLNSPRGALSLTALLTYVEGWLNFLTR